MLIDMGFTKEKAQRALEVTQFKGVEPAMEWLLAHVDENIPPSSTDTLDTTSQSTDIAEASAGAPGSSTNTTTVPESEDKSGEIAKSLKCDECNRLFKNQFEVEFHAAKSGHSSFSESTEEKKPLTEEERKAQLALLESKIKQKRLEREEEEKRDAIAKEKLRVKSGKDMLEAKARLEELEMKKIVEQRKREKAEEKAARDRVKAQIEADKLARKARLEGVPPGSMSSNVVQSPQPSVVPASTTPSKSYDKARLQLRLYDGSAITETFDAKESLAAVRVFLQMKLSSVDSFRLMTSFPKKVFSESDYEMSLESLGLVPSAVLIVTKSQ